MSPAERLIARQRAQLLRVERNGASEIARSYQAVLADLNRNLDAVGRQIAAARRAGEDVRPSWLFQQQRYRKLIADLERHTIAYLQRALRTILGTKGRAVELAGAHAPRLAVAAMGPAPRRAQAFVRERFTQLPGGHLDRIIRNAGNERPLGLLFAQAAPAAAEGVRDALAAGVARGAPLRAIAADVRRTAGMPLTRALTVARTEVLRAYRQTAGDMYRDSEVVRGWTLHAQLDDRTCPACYLSHGERFESEAEVFGLHPNCRCTALPVTASWRELGFDVPDGRVPITPGPERFAALDDAGKAAIIGRSRLDAYNAGRISLEEMVRPTRSPAWGRGRRPATLAELGL